MAQFLKLSEAIEANVRDGDAIAMEGFTHLIPFAAGHEIIRQKRKRLSLIRMTPDLIYDQLIGMGCAERMTFSWGGNPGVGSAELPRVNPAIKEVTCPYTGEKLATVPAVKLDVAIIHAQKADRKGNVLLEGIVGVQKEAVLAAKRSVVTVEEIVDELNPPSPNSVVLPSWTIKAVAVVPGGAHPSYTHGYYKRDNAFYKAWDEIARERDTFTAWMEENVLKKSPEVFARHAKKAA
jgi:glutaconate CoA-transferase subunit A